MEQLLFTPIRHQPFKVEVVGNAIRCITDAASDGGAANIIFSREGRTVNQIINDALFFLRTKGEQGIKIGTSLGSENSNTFEVFLKAFSNVANLGAFFSPILVEKGLAEYFVPEGEEEMWIRAKEA